MALSSRFMLLNVQSTRRLAKRCLCSSINNENVTFPERVFSGIQPTGIPHIGNYFGAIKNWIRLQDTHSSVMYSIVDLHSVTVPQDPAILRENIMSMTACLLACGIDPDRGILFQQSQVPYHTELAWILGCQCTLSRLAHLPTWKEKSAATKDALLGLYTYPVLQAADILLYKGTEVPVGEDQFCHIELARALAKLFNNRFGHLFPQPSILLTDLPRIKSFRQPDKKMSKSEANPNSRIDLTDSPDEIRRKVKKAVVDSHSELTYDTDNRPGISNLIGLECAITQKSPSQVCEENTGVLTGQYKLKLADLLIEELTPIRLQMERLLSDRHHLSGVIKKGRDRAMEIAEPNIAEVKSLVGFM
ncbi:tryptophan--tRNA ligase, mitochondrial-like [Mizuhopecten yessoensis]|uniref:Tryptophan--tRNA ligase, mitochondrial n=1 Tax=Mizuhopecten yessoensis TaxID=6573 RepID=A0A210QFQ6_MIZYE|nr:tryptophan--tRNA ligase, mitochondrial-like [Mizuhopecten yessoensis]OWF47575.1 Tryptophan--tRNA ligase, mitochondrial [Mizuhopecten yessoensis]